MIRPKYTISIQYIQKEKIMYVYNKLSAYGTHFLLHFFLPPVEVEVALPSFFMPTAAARLPMYGM